MQSASLKEIKTSLENLTNDELIAIISRLSRFKKENKELIAYLLFGANDEDLYMQSVKEQLDKAFETLNINSIYIAKKNIRKIIRLVNRYIKYSEHKSTEIALLIHVCKKIKDSGLTIEKSQALINIYDALLKRINNAINTLHEDLQYDFGKEIAELNII